MCINKNAFHKNKELINIDKEDIERKVLSKKDLYGKHVAFKCFIGYESKLVIVPLCIKLPQLDGYVQSFGDKNKYIHFLVHDKSS